MKKRKIELGKRLVLNSEKITDLSEQQKSEMMGGATVGVDESCGPYCVPVVKTYQNTCWNGCVAPITGIEGASLCNPPDSYKCQMFSKQCQQTNSCLYC